MGQKISTNHKDGVLFYGFEDALKSGDTLVESTKTILEAVEKRRQTAGAAVACTKVVAVEARGFVLATALTCTNSKLGLVLVRKPGKLAGEVVQSASFDLEYRAGEKLEMNRGVILPGEHVLVVDDVLATGNTARQAAQLVQQVGGVVDGVVVALTVETMPEPSLCTQQQNLKWFAEQGIDVYSLVTATPTQKPDTALLLDTPDVLASTSAKITKKLSPIPELPSVADPDFLCKLVNTHKLFQPIAPLEPVLDARAVIVAMGPMEELALNIQAMYPMRFRFARMIRHKQFPDGFPDLQFEQQENFRGRTVVYLLDLSKPECFLEQSSVEVALARQGCDFYVVNPYFAPGTMERVEREGTVATAETVMKTITAGMDGNPHFAFMDLHAPVERFYASPNVTVQVLTAQNHFLEIVKANKMTIVFPDEGSYKRSRELVGKSAPFYVCAKQRLEGDQRKLVMLSVENSTAYNDSVHPMDRPIMIWDDLVQSGGTIKEAVALVRAMVAEHRKTSVEQVTVNICVTHAVFPRDTYRRFMKGGDAASGIDKFYVTNTNPAVTQRIIAEAKVTDGSPFEVINVSAEFANWVAEIAMPAHKKNGRNYKLQKSFPTSIPVVVGSRSEVKLRAIEYAVNQVCEEHLARVIGTDAKSYVSGQPVDEEETRRGSLIRLAQAYAGYLSSRFEETRSPIHLIVSVENGVRWRKGKLEDFGFVHIILVDAAKPGEKAQFFETQTEAVVIPDEIAQLWLKKRNAIGDLNLTVGQIINEKYGCPADDWHAKFSNNKQSRVELIQKAIEKVLKPQKCFKPKSLFAQ